jgi:hypothetical protein
MRAGARRDSEHEGAGRRPARRAPGRPHPLLALQRAGGNAAVGRLLARQQAATPDAPATGPQRIDRHDVLIDTVRGPELHSHGGFEWYVTFSLPFPAEAGGFIIQELFQESTGTSHVEHFWECWRVPAGERAPTDRAGDYDDRYRHLNVGASQPARGWKRHVGVARFYPGPLPAEFGPDQSGVHFFLTRQRPAVWTGEGTRHDCYSEWDTGTGRNGLVAYAGTRELRAGSMVAFRPR